MKFKKILIPLITMFMLGGCVSNNSSSTELSSETPVSSESTSIETSSSSSQQTITPIAAGSVGGSLIEIDAGDYLLVDSTYTCSFSPSDCEDKQMTAEYDTSIIKVEFMENSKTVFKITALKEGSTYLMLRSVELDCLVFRQKVTCKNEIAQKEIEDFAVTVRIEENINLISKEYMIIKFIIVALLVISLGYFIYMILYQKL